MEDATLFAKHFLEDLLSFFGLKVDVEALIEEDQVIVLNVPSTHLNAFLIGSRSTMLRALHSIVASAVHQHSQERFRINLDIANYRKRRELHLTRQAKTWIKDALQQKRNKVLSPMSPADRRIIHQLANNQGLDTESIGEGAKRRVVLKPKKEQEKGSDEER